MFESGRAYRILTVIGMFFLATGLIWAEAHAQATELSQNPVKKSRSTSKTKAVLGISWLPGFCEKKPKSPECVRQTSTSTDARQFTLNGLWRVRKTYCGVDAALREQDKKKDWLAMPELSLAEDVRLELAKAMPGVASGFDRHQWVKYGTCSGLVADAYYGRSLAMLAVVNGSDVRRLFEDNLGGTIREEDVKAAFDSAFGPGAGNRVKMRCSKDGDRRVITGLTIGLGEADGEGELAALIAAAGETKFGCKEGVVDEAGLQ
jgi:ribonuclease T2